MYKCLAIIIICLSVVGCSSTQKKQNKHIATLIHTQKVAFESGRLDVAKKLNTELVKLVPAPKKKVILHEFRVQTWGNGEGILSQKPLLTDKVYTVLPENTDLKNLIVNGSPEYREILKSNPTTAKAEKANDKVLNKIENTTEEIRREKEAIVEKEFKRRWYDGILNIFKGFGIFGILGGIGLGLLLFFNPALFFTIINTLFRWIKEFFKFIIKIFQGDS